MKRITTFIAALVAILALSLSSASPVSATPTNDPWSRFPHECEFEFQYGNFGPDVQYAHYRSVGGDAVVNGYTYDCWMTNARVFYAKGSTQYVANNYTDYHDSNTWHGVTWNHDGASAWAADWFVHVQTTEPYSDDWCRQTYKMEASVFDGLTLGSLQTISAPHSSCESL